MRNLRLDQSFFRPSTCLIRLTEKLAGHYQSLTFLSRCKKNNLIPTFIKASLPPTTNIRATDSFNKFLARTGRQLLSHHIRSRKADIHHVKVGITATKEELPREVLERLDPILDIAKIESSDTHKARLMCKYNKLLTKRRNSPRKATRRNEEWMIEEERTHELNSKRVSIMDDIEVSQTALNVLAKGPNFVVTPVITQEDLQHTLQIETAALAYAMRWRSACRDSTATMANFDQLTKACPFPGKRKEPPRDHRPTEKEIQALQADLQQLGNRFKVDSIAPNLSRKEITAVLQLRDTPDLAITKSDKGGEFVILRESHLNELAIDHLEDMNTYKRLSRDVTKKLRLEVNKNLERILTQREFPKPLIARLQTPTTAKTQPFRVQPKTHKNPLKIRPVISARGGIFDRISWILQQILRPIIKTVDAHLKNTQDLLDRFKKVPKDQLKGLMPVSYDVVSLYTNIDADEAIETTLVYARNMKLYTYGLQMSELWELLHTLLDNNVFSYNGNYYQQVRGLAMGNRLSGTLAIICMDRFERNHIYTLRPKPPIYGRYIDDIGTVQPNEGAAEELLCSMNEKHDTIKFEMETLGPDGFLPLLDTALKILEDGTVEHRLYCKKANRGITLHYKSHQPTAIKKAVAQNELRRAVLCSSERFQERAIKETEAKLRDNGYPDRFIKDIQRPAKKKKPNINTQFTFKVQFVSDAFNSTIRRILRKHNIPARLVNPRGRTLQQLMRKKTETSPACPRRNACPAPEICQKTSVIYQASCRLCGADYVGMTTRHLHDRMREHIYAAKQKLSSAAFGDHYKMDHPNKTPEITFKILKRCQDELRLHIEEAMCIQALRPSLNRREEDMGTGFLV